MDQLVALTISIALLVFIAGVLVQMTGAMFGHKPNWFASLGWLVRNLRKGVYNLLMTVANIFRDGAREINRSIRRQPFWQRVIFWIISLLPLTVWFLFWLPARIVGKPN